MVPDVIDELLSEYRQANLITTAGDAEWKMSKSDSEVLLGADKLKRKLSGEAPNFERAIEELDRRKNYLLSGNEKFLIQLGISDKSGRVHDKKQGKFRQINRFLEYIEGIYQSLPAEGELTVYDLCCGKSYLSFAVYYFLTELKGRRVRMLGIDLKRDVIEWCAGLARELGFVGMRFVTDDVTNTPKDEKPDMVISLHACDIATDVVIDTAARLGAGVILSTPCCHRYLNGKVSTPELGFITAHPHLSNKLCEAITDSLRLFRLRAAGYAVSAPELTDPDDTPKNTLIRAIKDDRVSDSELAKRKQEYEAALKYILGEKSSEYLKECK
jgi:SAM-dependent methyltransferase